MKATQGVAALCLTALLAGCQPYAHHFTPTDTNRKAPGFTEKIEDTINFTYGKGRMHTLPSGRKVTVSYNFQLTPKLHYLLGVESLHQEDGKTVSFTYSRLKEPSREFITFFAYYENERKIKDFFSLTLNQDGTVEMIPLYKYDSATAEYFRGSFDGKNIIWKKDEDPKVRETIERYIKKFEKLKKEFYIEDFLAIAKRRQGEHKP